MQSIRQQPPKWLPFAQFTLAPVVIYLYMEYLATGRVFRAPLYMLLGYVLILLIQLLLLAIFRKSRVAQMITSILCFALAVISYMKMDFRGTPLLPWDIFAAGTAIAVAAHYAIRFSARVLVCLLLCLCTVIFARRYDFELQKSRGMIATRALTVVLCGLGFLRFYSSALLLGEQGQHRTTWSPSEVYEEYGFGVGLWANARRMEVQRPRFYNLVGLREVQQHMDEEENPVLENAPSDIVIAIMNETFSDLSRTLPFTPSRDPMPFVRETMADSVSGTLHVSVLGGGTSTSEFELLTGNTSRFLPLESTAYRQYLTAEQDNGYSIASHLKSEGFRTVAIHPGEPDAWSRDQAYPLMGFDAFYALPDMPDAEDPEALLRGYYRDEGVYRRIIEQYETTAPDEKLFVLAVTIQNHGDYYGKEEISQDPVYILEAPEEARGSEYLSLVARSDSAFADFLAEVAAWERPTTVLFFGDHQPRLPDESYLAMCGDENPLEWPEEQRVPALYTTPFLIWRNDGITPRDMGDLSLNYLGGLLLEEAGYVPSAYQRFLSELREELPVVTAFQLMNAKGQVLSLEQAREQVPGLYMYQTAQYNLLFDKAHKQRALFE